MTNEVNNPADLLAALRARGVRLAIVEDERGLTPTYGGAALSDADRTALAEQREGVLRLLIREAQDAAASRDDPRAGERQLWGRERKT